MPELTYESLCGRTQTSHSVLLLGGWLVGSMDDLMDGSIPYRTVMFGNCRCFGSLSIDAFLPSDSNCLVVQCARSVVSGLRLYMLLFGMQLFQMLQNLADPPGGRSGQFGPQCILVLFSNGLFEKIKQVVLLVNEIQPGVGRVVDIEQ